VSWPELAVRGFVLVCGLGVAAAIAWKICSWLVSIWPWLMSYSIAEMMVRGIFAFGWLVICAGRSLEAAIKSWRQIRDGARPKEFQCYLSAD